MAETERGIENMLNAIQMGIINQSTKQRLDELEERKKEIELHIIQEEIKNPLLSREDVTFWICRFRKFDVSKLEERRRLIDSFVNSVTIFDDYILITFNYKDGETRLDFKDIESSDLQSVGGPRRSKVRFAPTFFYSCGTKERHPPAPLLLLPNCDPLCWARSWRAALRAAFFVSNKKISFNHPLQTMIIRTT